MTKTYLFGELVDVVFRESDRESQPQVVVVGDFAKAITIAVDTTPCYEMPINAGNKLRAAYLRDFTVKSKRGWWLIQAGKVMQLVKPRVLRASVGTAKD